VKDSTLRAQSESFPCVSSPSSCSAKRRDSGGFEWRSIGVGLVFRFRIESKERFDIRDAVSASGTRGK
jgi:hypothetical protein